MKVLLLLASPGPDIGGMERQVALQAKNLSRYPDLELGVLAAPCYRDLFHPELPLFPVSMTRSRRNPLLLWQVIQTVRTFKPDLIHAHGHKAADLTKSIRKLFKTIKLVGTAHGTKRHNRALQHLDQIFAVSKGVQKAVLPLPSLVLENGIEPYQGPVFTKAEFCQSLNLDPSLPLVLAVGRLVPVKRYEQLILAFKTLPANMVILGDGPERKHLESMASANVTLTGFRADVRAIMPAADLLVITSEREGYSLTMIEALQSELPVLSTRVSGSEDLLPADCLIESVEEQPLRAFLQQSLKRSDPLRVQLQPVFAYARSALTIERLAQQTHDHYHALHEGAR